MPRSSVATSRPPLPVPRLRRWPTPLWRDRMARVLNLICPTWPAKYFCAEGWTGFVDLPVGLLCRGHHRHLFIAGAGESRAEPDFVGWVERSETHQFRCVTVMGFALLNPSYDLRSTTHRHAWHASSAT